MHDLKHHSNNEISGW